MPMYESVLETLGMGLRIMRPVWPAPMNVRAAVTTRHGGMSKGAYASMNLGMHVGDDPDMVVANRQLLVSALNLPSEPVWLEQVHGTAAVDAAAASANTVADATVACKPGGVCAVMTADCLPVFFCDRAGTRVAVAHAGWRGLAAGVLEATMEKLDVDPGELLAWLGPAIGPTAFEVGEEVREIFMEQNANSHSCFKKSKRPGHYLADLYGLARLRLQVKGLQAINGGDCCTYTDADNFFSYRRDGDCGRMASLIWLEPTLSLCHADRPPNSSMY